MGIKEDAIQEMMDSKMRESAGRAYDKAMPKPDTTFGKLDDLVYRPKNGKMVDPRPLDDLVDRQERDPTTLAPKKKPRLTNLKAGGSVSSASKRADGIATKGKTKGRMIAMCGGGKM
jgi:hypothetical protein